MSDLSLQPILVLLSQSAAANPSQYMVEKAFQRHQLDWRYVTVEVSDDDLEDAVRGIRAMGFAGGNCARPYHRRIGSSLDQLGLTAQRTGTVNLIRRDEDGRLVGENTEGIGLVQAVQAVREKPVRRVLLFGAGALATSAALELAAAGAEDLLLVNRTEEHAQPLIQLLDEHYEITSQSYAWGTVDELPEEIDLVVNATPVGSGAAEGVPPLQWQALSLDATVVDANLEETVPALLRDAAERDLVTVNGLEIFLERAAIDFCLWTGVEPDKSVMREAVEEYLEL